MIESNQEVASQILEVLPKYRETIELNRRFCGLDVSPGWETDRFENIVNEAQAKYAAKAFSQLDTEKNKSFKVDEADYQQ